VTSPRSLLLFLWLALASALALAGSGATSAAFPRPAALGPAIAFWTRVYTEIDTGSGFIHDDRRLDVVYQVRHLNADLSPAAQNKSIRQALGSYRKALLSLAGGKRKALTATERRALHAWGKSAKRAALRAAAERVRFQRGQADRFNEGLSRSAKWRRRIEGIFRRQGLPTELAALPHVESSYNPAARSSAGAAGLWQLMPATASRYLHVDKKRDERLDPYKSSEAAARLLQHNYSVLQSWPLALTAYNHGLSGMRQAVISTGTEDIARIIEEYNSDSFGFASRNFYPAFLAALDVSRAPESYFGKAREKFGPRPLRVRTAAYLPVDAVAKAFGTDAQQLCDLNPGLPRTVRSGKLFMPKGYPLHLPPSHTLVQAKHEMARLARTIGYQSQRPDVYHEVRAGESLSEIAQKYGKDTAELAAINGLDSEQIIRAGQLLLIASGPAPERVRVRVRSADRDRQSPGILPLETQPDLAADPADYSVRADGTIVVQASETLGHYAEWLGVTSKRLRQLNRLGASRGLVIGHRLKLDLSKTSRTSFQRRRIAYHQSLQASYFQDVHIAGLRQHRVQSGDTLWRLAEQRYGIPLWLLRQYNPDIALDSVLPLGGVISVPVLAKG